jgi:hypothetical protein
MIEFEFVFKDLAYSDKLKFQREIIKPHVIGRDSFAKSMSKKFLPVSPRDERKLDYQSW